MYVSVIDTNNAGQQAVLGRVEVPLSRLSATQNGVEVVRKGKEQQEFSRNNTDNFYRGISIFSRLGEKLTSGSSPPMESKVFRLPPRLQLQTPYPLEEPLRAQSLRVKLGCCVRRLLARIRSRKGNNNSVGCFNIIPPTSKEFSHTWQVCREKGECERSEKGGKRGKGKEEER